MKWVIFISLLCLVGFAELKNLPRRYRHTDDHQLPLNRVFALTNNEFAGLALILFTQSVPNATFEEVKKLAETAVALYQKCRHTADSGTECTKPLSIVFLDVLCHDEEFSNKYGINDCCAKADPERNECILSHKLSFKENVSSFVHPTGEEACQAYQNNPNAVLAILRYKKTKRYLHAPAVLFLDSARNSEIILKVCCIAENKDACIQEKAIEFEKKFWKILDEYKNTCFNLEKYGKDTLYTLKFIETTEKFINANQETISHIAKGIVHIYEENCKGDSLEALLYQVALVEYVCKNQLAISSNLHQCCMLHLIERPACIASLENDARSPDLPPPSGEILKETEACKLYAEQGDGHKESFLFTLTRNHPELSKLLDLEILHKYEELLQKCCKEENQVQCLHTGEEQLKLYITKITDVVKTNCDNYKEIGGYFFQNVYLIKYTRIIPQAPTSNLIEITKRVAKVAEKCCNLDSNHQVSCALENTDKVIGSVCRYHKEHFINKQLCHCCDSSFISRWECISNLGPDPSYVPPPFRPKVLDAPENLCSPNEETVQESKQCDLIKSKPNISDEMLASAIEAFRNLQADCCAAENKKECFDTKGQKLVEDIQNDHIIQ
ncbi:serum albumin-like [Protobothrops mucrosquamatus]|uniref:serum albumin-like n=1 Tax=Protobothrops mucrosquamatus TaxID=103944 RepID=UPI0007757B21|nr:serum albumin-like [Protobothrops mucrosquamatus]